MSPEIRDCAPRKHVWINFTKEHMKDKFQPYLARFAAQRRSPSSYFLFFTGGWILKHLNVLHQFFVWCKCCFNRGSATGIFERTLPSRRANSSHGWLLEEDQQRKIIYQRWQSSSSWALERSTQLLTLLRPLESTTWNIAAPVWNRYRRRFKQFTYRR